MNIRKIFSIVLLILILMVGLYYFIRNKYHVDTNLVKTLVQAPSEDVSKLLPQGSDLSEPFTIPDGFRLAVFADLSSFGVPRVLKFDPNGVLLASLPGEGKVVSLPDKNKDGISDEIIEVITGLDKPHGIAFDQEGRIYVAETGQVVRYSYDGDTLRAFNPEVLFDLPSGGRHSTRTIEIHEGKLYTSVGSSCDVCDEEDERRASILVSDLDGSNLVVFAKGLRNTVFFTFDSNGQIWGADMGRDFLGDNLPPEELNIISRGKDFGWPYCYGNRIRDTQYKHNAEFANYCLSTEPSVYDMPAHIAPLGITFINSDLFGPEDNGDILVAQHGSWNSSVPVGYKIVKLDMQNGKVAGSADFISGFIKSNGDILGRPVDMVFDEDGVLYISDDKSDLIYILTK